jgi:PAS domain S-box-containing protein
VRRRALQLVVAHAACFLWAVMPGSVEAEIDWSATPIGPREQWPASLRAVVNLVVESRIPMAIFWGPSQTAFYNAAYRDVVGDRGLGCSAAELGEDRALIAELLELGGSREVERVIGRAAFVAGYSAVRDADGAPGGVLVVLQDRTETERLRTLVANSRDGLNLLDLRTGRYVFTNPAQVAMTGFTAEEISAEESAARVHPDDRHVSVEQMIGVAAGMDPGSPVEYRWRVKSGEYRWFSDTRKLVCDAQGRPIALVGVSRDITDLRRADEAHREDRQTFLLKLSDALLPLRTPDEIRTTATRILGEELHVNRAVYAEIEDDDIAVIGAHYTRDAPPLAARIRASVYGEDVIDAFRRGETVVIDDVATTPLLDGRARRSLQEVGIAAMVATSLRKEGRWLGGFAVHSGRPRDWQTWEIVLVEETTERTWAAIERARAELAALRTSEQLREADRRKNELLAMLSHELRNPLGAMGNAIAIVERADPNSAQSRRAHTIIARQVEHMTRLIDDLLEATRITRGKIELHREKVELGELLERLCEDYAAEFARAGVSLELRRARDAVWVDGDRTRLAQAIGNLLENAAKFTPRGGQATLWLSVERDRARIRVQDTGRGIAADLLDHVFEPFAQGDTTLDRRMGGLGLGLAVARGLVELHGGTICVESTNPGKGTTFVIQLPALPEASAVESATGAHPEASARHVLVIEDNRDAAEALSTLLELEGHVVDLAYDGPQGLARARESHPDVVICDIGLPEMSGLDVARAMRADPGLAPLTLVALTGYSQPEDVARAKEAGFDRHLAKPLELDVLRQVIAAAPAHAA